MEVPPATVTLEKVKADFDKWDSLRHLDLIMEIEAEFGCSLTMAEAASLGSVREIVEAVTRKLAQ
jgi:acyl carrier protein